MSWIKKKDNEKIQEIFQDINKNFIEIGKILAEHKEIEKEDTLKKYNLSKNKVKEYINIYKFIKKYNIKSPEQIGLLKLKFLIKIKDENILKEFLEKDLINIELKQLREEIKTKVNAKVYKKSFDLYEDDITLWETAKEIVKNMANQEKLSNSQVFRLILADFVANNINYIQNEKVNKKDNQK